LDPELPLSVEEICRKLWGEPPQGVERILPDGSDRAFFRLRFSKGSMILLMHPEGVASGENDSYVALARHFRKCGISVPEVVAYLRERGLIFMEDLGKQRLQEAVVEAVDSDAVRSLYDPVLRLLLFFQLRAKEGFDERWCYQGARYDVALMMELESGYFLNAFLKGYLGWRGDEGPLWKEFERLALEAARAPSLVVIHRDFQSRNILLPEPHRPYMVDFQGARWGPPQYDMASLLLDPYVSLPPSLQEEFLLAYARLQEEAGLLPAEEFLRDYPPVALHRNLQILGAFGRLGGARGKTFFLQWIPTALKTLEALMKANPRWDCPALKETLQWARMRILRPTYGDTDPTP
jgi:hypothetical protein